MRLPLSRRLAILGCCLFVFACSDPLAPENVAGLYVLERIGSDALPAVLYENDYHVVRVTSGSLRLRPDGSGMITGVEESIPWQDGQSTRGPVWSEQPIRFRTTAGRIEIEFLCPPNANCAPPPHMVAWRTSRGIRATWFESRTPLYYARVVSAE